MDLYTPNLRGTLDHVLIALRANGAISLGNVLDIQTARIGVAGYSGGGNEAIKVWNKANHRNVDELYLLDPQSFAKDQGRGVTLLVNEKGALVPALREWFKDDRRRLRMIGGLQHEMALFIANLLDPDWKKKLVARESSDAPAPRVWCKPTETKFRLGLGDDIIYSWALLPQPKDGKFDAASLAGHRLSAAGGTASALTSETGLELIEEKKPNEVACRVTALGKDVKFPVSHAELAGFLRTVWVPGRDASMQDAPGREEQDFWKRRQQNGNPKVVDEPILGDLRNLVSLYLLHGRDREQSFNRDKLPVIHRAFGVRHQWVSSGGEKDPSRGAKFDGYFFLCLRDSAFRK